MAFIPGTIVSDAITVGDTTANRFGTHYSFQGVGGASEVINQEELYAIPLNPASGVLNQGDPLSSGRRRMGMIVYVIEENKYYKLYDPDWNTYTTDQDRYNSLQNNANWRDAFSDLYLPLAGGTMAGAIGLIDGTPAAPSLYFNSAPGTGFCLTDKGINVSAKGRKYVITEKGLETFDSISPTMSLGEANTISNSYSYVFGSYSEATNYVTTAMGTVVKALGQYATVIGSFSDASGDHSTTVGLKSVSSGFRATAVGNNLTASQSYATTVGTSNDVAASYATAVGNYLSIQAGSGNSTLIGMSLSSTLPRSVVIGVGISNSSRLVNNLGNSIFLGVNSTVPSLYVGGGNGSAGSLGNIGINLTNPFARIDILEGNDTIAPFRIRKNLQDKAQLLDGEFQFASTGRLQFSSYGITNETIAYLSDIPFEVSGNNGLSIKSIFGNNTAFGNYSFAVGMNNNVFADNSTVFGSYNTIYGENSDAFGSNNSVVSPNSHAEGISNRVNAYASHAEGQNCTIGNPIRNFTVNGTTVTISGNVTSEFPNAVTAYFFNLTGGTNLSYLRNISGCSYSAGETTFTINETMPGVLSGSCVVPAFGEMSHAEGANTSCFGTACHAEGNSTSASGHFSHAEGYYSIASGQGSHAEGNVCTASGYYSHAQGSFTTASGQYSHAQGENTISAGTGSHAEGSNTLAMSSYTHAGGIDSVADKHAQFARSGGRFSVPGDAQYSQVYAKAETVDSTAQELTLNGIEPLTIPYEKVWGFVIYVVAKQTGGLTGTIGASAFFESKGLIKNIGGIATLVGETRTIVNRDAGTNSWDLIVTVNASSSYLKMEVTGDENKTIRWFATVNLIEVA